MASRHMIMQMMCVACSPGMLSDLESIRIFDSDRAYAMTLQHLIADRAIFMVSRFTVITVNRRDTVWLLGKQIKSIGDVTMVKTR